MGLPNPFPKIDEANQAFNPAIRLFGSRFFTDQTVVELLAEFMSVAFSEKWIGSNGPIKNPLPPLPELYRWASVQGEKLKYKPPIKLNLKLFALLCASPLDSRHKVHEDHYEKLMKTFTEKVRTWSKKPEEVKEWVEDFLMGFQGAGFERTWCAQTFYPVTTSFLVQETLWNNTVAKNSPLTNWLEGVHKFHTYYSVSKHRFLARGGELLYLQLCNLFAGKGRDIASLAKAIDASPAEADLNLLHLSLQKGLQGLQNEQFVALDKLVDYIENLDPETHWKTNKEDDKLSCEWCPEDSWQEAYLFAVEISRVLRAALDPVERLELLQIGCALQVMRSLCAQSIRYADLPITEGKGSVLGYAWVFSPLEGFTRQQRLATCHNLQMVFRLIQRAIHNEDLVKHAAKHRESQSSGPDWLLREAENKYGHKLFRTLGKRLGIIGPWRGAEPRFILTDKLLRYLVLSVLAPGERYQYHQFRHRLYCQYGIAVEGEELLDAVVWSGLPANSSVQPEKGSWLTQMLRAGGFLIELSDGCSIVHNPFSSQF
ncbi:hypothetical protein H0A61_02541 [Koleobacter methoxysyntrophicus]|uniref:Uncharacterized protein n=1 Tax=Koleobacter methoxysyntrophicus TaxID=2751313 RepID=A0A8A0RQG8_9FIRM|nr:hypothetical protein [Koleobacter methoxysyntrophicus]QSQ10142.1 hypothetical protein H0A61_02541 [Koleobacter methoxysyntrophicus]